MPAVDRDRRTPGKDQTPPAPAGAGSGRSRRVIVGRFGAAHGVRGEIRLQSFTQDPAAIADLGPLTDASGARVFALEKLRPVRDAMFVARVKGVSDRNLAETLTNVEIFADRANFPAESEDEFYVTDLIGLSVFFENGDRAGSVLTIVNFGAGDILEIRPEHGGETLLVPFTKAAVPAVDIAAGRVVIAPPAEVEAKPPDGGSDEA